MWVTFSWVGGAAVDGHLQDASHLRLLYWRFYDSSPDVCSLVSTLDEMF